MKKMKKKIFLAKIDCSLTGCIICPNDVCEKCKSSMYLTEDLDCVSSCDT